MGVARIKSGGVIKSVVTRGPDGAELSRFEPARPVAAQPQQPPPPREPLPEPAWDEMIGHLGTALIKWAASGFKIAPPEVRAERYAICRACGYWKDDGNLGLGKCTHHKCGCTKAKFHLASERCPDDPPKWKAIES
jgi:hypothetical protein